MILTNKFMSKLYYTAPEDKIFDEVREKATEVWKQYDNSYGYVDEKLNWIKDWKNVEDNVMSLVGMFDMNNQRKLARLLSDEAKEAIRVRLIDGGNDDDFISTIGFN